MADLSPAEIVACAADLGHDENLLIKSLRIFSRLIDRLPTCHYSDIAAACDVASIGKFAKAVPPDLDQYLWFDRFESEEALLGGSECGF